MPSRLPVAGCLRIRSVREHAASASAAHHRWFLGGQSSCRAVLGLRSVERQTRACSFVGSPGWRLEIAHRSNASGGTVNTRHCVDVRVVTHLGFVGYGAAYSDKPQSGANKMCASGSGRRVQLAVLQGLLPEELSRPAKRGEHPENKSEDDNLVKKSAPKGAGILMARCHWGRAELSCRPTSLLLTTRE